MTEIEAKSFIQGKVDCMKKCDVFECKGTDECDSCNYCYSQGTFCEQKKAFEMAIKALEELQQYRAIGTIEEFKALKDGSIPIIHGKAELELHDRGIRNKAIDEFAEKLNTDVESFVAEVDGVRADLLTLDYFSEFVFEVAEQLKGVQE